MGSHPVNLAVRFLLELGALIACGMWGWRMSDGWFRYVLAVAIPVILAIIWGMFAVPNDPSRSGAAPVPTPGIIRLLLELAFFGFATWCMREMGYMKAATIYGVIVIIHYALSYDKISWLLTK